MFRILFTCVVFPLFLTACAGSALNPAGSTSLDAEVKTPQGKEISLNLKDVKDRQVFDGSFEQTDDNGKKTIIKLKTQDSSASAAIESAAESNKVLLENLTKTINTIEALLAKLGIKVAGTAVVP